MVKKFNKHAGLFHNEIEKVSFKNNLSITPQDISDKLSTIARLLETSKPSVALAEQHPALTLDVEILKYAVILHLKDPSGKIIQDGDFSIDPIKDTPQLTNKIMRGLKAELFSFGNEDMAKTQFAKIAQIIVDTVNPGNTQTPPPSEPGKPKLH